MNFDREFDQPHREYIGIFTDILYARKDPKEFEFHHL